MTSEPWVLGSEVVEEDDVMGHCRGEAALNSLFFGICHLALLRDSRIQSQGQLFVWIPSGSFWAVGSHTVICSRQPRDLNTGTDFSPIEPRGA
uniref:Uncharacterized protein n=1 Tax=Paramormyrops kingsleyae TaxID=1676925 RepID=A0A3B3RH48_9TELE